MNAITKLEEIGAIRTLSRNEYLALARTARQNPDLTEAPPNERYATLCALRDEIAVEIAPAVKRLQDARQYLFRGAEDRVLTVHVAVSSSIVIPPPIDDDLTALTDKEGPKQKIALAKLDALPAKLKGLLDDQLRSRLPYLLSLD